jgi:hypothetical protein
VFGHFGEFNDGLIKLVSDISRSIAHQHHRALGFKSVKGGLSRAKAGVMRRLSMVALRCTARQLLRGSPSSAPRASTSTTLASRRAAAPSMTRSVLTATPRGATPPTAEAKRRPGGEGARRPHSPTPAWPWQLGRGASGER